VGSKLLAVDDWPEFVVGTKIAAVSLRKNMRTTTPLVKQTTPLVRKYKKCCLFL
jgi:hypothetical protein